MVLFCFGDMDCGILPCRRSLYNLLPSVNCLVERCLVEAGLRGDVTLLLGIVIFSTLFVFVGNLLADVIYQFVDPRTRREN